MDLQPAVQEVQGGVLGTQECQGQPQTGTGSGVRDWGAGMGMREAPIRAEGPRLQQDPRAGWEHQAERGPE